MMLAPFFFCAVAARSQSLWGWWNMIPELGVVPSTSKPSDDFEAPVRSAGASSLASSRIASPKDELIRCQRNF